MSAETPNLMSVAQLAEHYGRAKKTIQNKLTRGWGASAGIGPGHGTGARLPRRGGEPF